MKMRRICIVLVILLVLLILTFLGIKYGWRLFGFRLCDQPDSVSVISIEVKDDLISLSGTTTGSAEKYDGYILKIEGDTAYVGIKTKLLFASTDLGAFDIDIPLKTPVSKVVLKGSGNERVLYPEQ